MRKIKKECSVSLSLGLAVAALIAIGLIAVFLPSIVMYYLRYLNAAYLKRTVPALILLYGALIPAGVADFLLIRLLFLVKKARIFTHGAVALLRYISWCSFFDAVWILLVGSLFFAPFVWLVVCVSFVAVFLGIVLRVVKNVIEEATAIKEENDYTV